MTAFPGNRSRCAKSRPDCERTPSTPHNRLSRTGSKHLKPEIMDRRGVAVLCVAAHDTGSVGSIPVSRMMQYASLLLLITTASYLHLLRAEG